MENTIKNKARFFAQYYGQKVYKSANWQDEASLLLNIENCKFYGTFLELTPLSQITDEDLIELNKVTDWDLTKENLTRDLWVNIFIQEKYPMTIGFDILDLLRSKGYALPFMGISVETLVEWGWVKLKTSI